MAGGRVVTGAGAVTCSDAEDADEVLLLWLTVVSSKLRGKNWTEEPPWGTLVRPWGGAALDDEVDETEDEEIEKLVLGLLPPELADPLHRCEAEMVFERGRGAGGDATKAAKADAEVAAEDLGPGSMSSSEK